MRPAIDPGGGVPYYSSDSAPKGVMSLSMVCEGTPLAREGDRPNVQAAQRLQPTNSHPDCNAAADEVPMCAGSGRKRHPVRLGCHSSFLLQAHVAIVATFRGRRCERQGLCMAGECNKGRSDETGGNNIPLPSSAAVTCRDITTSGCARADRSLFAPSKKEFAVSSTSGAKRSGRDLDAARHSRAG